MRPVAQAALSFPLRTALHRLRALLLTGGGAIVLVSILHAGASVLSDVGADCVEDLVDGRVGRIGRWLLLAAFLIVCARRTCKRARIGRPRRSGSFRRAQAKRRAARFDLIRFTRRRSGAARRFAWAAGQGATRYRYNL